jgi:hypothetical protein
MLDENIGTDEVLRKDSNSFSDDLNKYFKIVGVGEDVKDILTEIGLTINNLNETEYYIVAFARLVEQLMDRPENRSDTNLRIPPQNSTLPQNYCKFINKNTCEIISTTKWIYDGMREKYTYTLKFRQLENDTNYEIFISDEQKKLNAHPLRQFAKMIVLCIKNKEIKKIGPENLSQLLSEPFRSALFKFQEIIEPGGYYNKYLKYKNKYLELKKIYSSNNINAIAE